MSAALRVLRAEGVSAFVERLRDRAAEWRRQRRFSVRRASDRAAIQASVLNVLPVPPHAREGGLAVQFLRRMDAESALRPWALLYREGAAYRLETTSGRRRNAEVMGTASRPAVPALEDAAFEDVIAQAARRVGAAAIHFEGLAGLPLRSVARLGANHRLIFSIHDFALFCARPHLVQRPEETFCNYCADLGRCQLCLRESFAVPDGYQAAYREAGRDALAQVKALVFPSRFLKERHAALFTLAPGVVQRVIAPPVLPPLSSAASAAAPRGATRIALVGAVHAHKGAGVFEEVVRLLRTNGRRDLRWRVLGGGDPRWLSRLRALPAVEVAGYYRAGSLPAQLRRHQIRLALLLSTVPEAYGLTFDECLSARVPVIAFDHGAIADRIRERGGGWLVPLTSGAQGVAAILEQILDGTAGRVEAAPPTGPDAESVARAHLALYAGLSSQPGGG